MDTVDNGDIGMDYYYTADNEHIEFSIFSHSFRVVCNNNYGEIFSPLVLYCPSLQLVYPAVGPILQFAQNEKTQ